MTKAELIKALEEYPDDSIVKIEVDIDGFMEYLNPSITKNNDEIIITGYVNI